MKIIFMGTPDFSVGALEAIIEAGHEVTLVVTQPDKPKGRSGQMQFSPVKECALKHGIPVFQPERIKRPESVEELKKYEAEMFVVVAFGQMLSQEILDMPKYGCINIHASLLPNYRGCAPINWCIINGEKETGVTIMKMNIGCDTGDMLLKSVVPIAAKETAETLFDKLAIEGARLIVEAIPKIESGELVPEKQDENEFKFYAKMMDKALGEIDWKKPAVEIERLVRGLNSWPSAFTHVQGKTLKIWDSDVIREEAAHTPGEIIAVNKDSFDVACGEGVLRILELQLEGKKRMDTKSFLLGNQWKPGMLLGK